MIKPAIKNTTVFSNFRPLYPFFCNSRMCEAGFKQWNQVNQVIESCLPHSFFCVEKWTGEFNQFYLSDLLTLHGQHSNWNEEWKKKKKREKFHLAHIYKTLTFPNFLALENFLCFRKSLAWFNYGNSHHFEPV